jgi:hypothetical protein
LVWKKRGKNNLIGTRTRLVCHEIINEERKEGRKNSWQKGTKGSKSKQKTTLKSKHNKCIFDDTGPTLE